MESKFNFFLSILVHVPFVLLCILAYTLLVAFYFHWISWLTFHRQALAFLETLSWLGCLLIKSFWNYPFLFLPLFLAALCYKQWKTVTLLLEFSKSIFRHYFSKGQSGQHDHPLHKMNKSCVHCYQLHGLLSYQLF